MAKVTWVKPTEKERFNRVWDETNVIIKCAMVRQGVKTTKALAALMGTDEHTISNRFNRKSQWKHNEICKVVTKLKIPPEEAVKMIGC